MGDCILLDLKSAHQKQDVTRKLENSSNINRVSKKRTGVKKLLLYGEEERLISTADFQNGWFFSHLIRRMILIVYKIIEVWIHILKFYFDYFLGGKVLFYFANFTLKGRRIEGSDRIVTDSTQVSEKQSEESSQDQISKKLNGHSLDFEHKQISPDIFRSMKLYEDHPNNLIIDLDETLVHCDRVKLNDEAVQFQVDFQDGVRQYYLHQRSYLQDFLEQCAENFNIYIYTASRDEYAQEVVRLIDPKAIIKDIFSRDSCNFDGKQFNKNIELLGLQNLSRTVFIDNSQIQVDANKEYSFKIEDFTHDTNDTELLRLLQILKEMSAQEGSFIEYIQNLSSTQSH